MSVPIQHRLMRDIPRLGSLSTQDDLAIMIEGTDGQYYLQAGAILLPGPSLPILVVPSFYYFLVVSDMRTQVSGVSKTKLAFRWTQSIRPATYRTVRIFLFPLFPICTPSLVAVAR